MFIFLTKTVKTLFLVFMSYTHTFSICPSENPSKLPFSARHIENSLAAKTPEKEKPRLPPQQTLRLVAKANKNPPWC